MFWPWEKKVIFYREISRSQSVYYAYRASEEQNKNFRVINTLAISRTWKRRIALNLTSYCHKWPLKMSEYWIPVLRDMSIQSSVSLTKIPTESHSWIPLVQCLFFQVVFYVIVVVVVVVVFLCCFLRLSMFPPNPFLCSCFWHEQNPRYFASFRSFLAVFRLRESKKVVFFMPLDSLLAFFIPVMKRQYNFQSSCAFLDITNLRHIENWWSFQGDLGWVSFPDS